MGIRRVFRLPFLRGKDVARDVDEELAFHVAMREAKLRASGLSGDEARRAAEALFGDVHLIRERCVEESQQLADEERAMRTLEDDGRDRRYAVRSLLRAKRFAVAVVLTLAVGIGLNVTVFGVINEVVLRPVTGVRSVEDVFELSEVTSYTVFRGLQDALPDLGIAASSTRGLAVQSSDATQLEAAGLVSGNFFDALGVRMATGRPLGPADDVPGAPAVVVLSHAYWSSRFGSDPDVLGRTLTVNGASLTIVGVAASEFRGLAVAETPQFWFPISVWPQVAPTSMRDADLNDRGWEWAHVIGRLPSGMSLEQAHEAVFAAWRVIDPETPEDYVRTRTTPRQAHAAALPIEARDAAVRFSAVLVSVVVLVLLAACANITGLLLARATHRRQEIAVRVALGAGRWRLVRQLTAESMVLAAAAGVLGLGLFYGVSMLLSRATLPGGIPGSTLALELDVRLLLCAAAVTIVVGFAIGLTPASQARRMTMASIKSGAGSAPDGRQRLRGVLVSAQIAVAVALLLGTGLFARALSRALAVDLGFDPEKVVVVGANGDHVKLETSEAAAMRATAVERVARIPGVTGVTWAGNLPLTGSFDRQSAVVDGYTPADGERVAFEYSGVGARYHEVMGIPILQGRGFDDRDITSGEPVAIINETAARRYFAGRNPIGATIRMGGVTGRVVGVARDIVYHRLNEDPRPYLYFPLSDVRQDLFFVRAEQNAGALLRDVEQAVRETSPGVPVVAFGTLQDRLQAVLAPQLGGAWLLGGFGALALFIAVVGIYGVVAYTVEQRTREIGIRIAIGARAFDVLSGVIVRSVVLVAIGTGAGLALGIGLGRASQGFLFGVPPHDPATVTATVVTALLVGVLAAAVPARRAVRIDPSMAIRADG